jgi:hypothetical protein
MRELFIFAYCVVSAILFAYVSGHFVKDRDASGSAISLALTAAALASAWMVL